MGVKLVSASAGSVEIVAPATASNYTATMPAGTGTVMLQTATGTNITPGTKYQVGGVTTNALAWVNFNGTAATIRSAYNVSSITRNSAGDYTVNFTTALSDANYCCNVTSANGNIGSINSNAAAPTTSAVRVISFYPASAVDVAYMNVSIFGN